MKRPKTPETGEEPRFLIINHAYPLHANLEVQEDTEALARWLGCIISPEYLIALHHKPSARNMIIVEINRTRPGRNEWRRLLGAHKWNEFLVAPSPEEKDQVSRIYYCQYSMVRQVEKSGWKRIFMKDTWFIPGNAQLKNEAPELRWDQWESSKQTTNLIRFPYPLSTYCDVPTEDPTNSELARPLPVEYFPRPKPQAAPTFVVGSDQWVNTKNKPAGARTKGKSGAQKKHPTFSNASSPPVTRGRTTVGSGTVGVPLAPPGLPAPLGPSLPPGLTYSNNTTTNNSSSSSDLDYLEIQTAAALRIDDEYCHPDVVSEGLDHAAVMNDVALVNLPPSTEVVSSLWDEAPKPEGEVLLCSVHRLVCSKGICSEYSRQLREQERQKRDEQCRGRGRNGPPNNRGRNGAERTNFPKYPVRGRGGRGRGARGNGRGGGSSWASRPIDADNDGTATPHNNNAPEEAEGSISTLTEQPNAWETASAGPW